MFDTVGSRSTLSWDVPLALFETEPFSAAIPLSGDDGSYNVERTGLALGGAAGGGATTGLGGSGTLGLEKKHMYYSPNRDRSWSSNVLIKNSTTER